MKKHILFMLTILVVCILLLGCSGKKVEKKSDKVPPVVQNPPQVKQPVEEPVKDCGTSLSMSSDDIMINGNTEVLEADTALTCMGDSLLDGCIKAKAVLETTSGVVKFEIKGKIESQCIIRVEYGDEGDLIQDDLNKYANTFLECPMNIDDIISLVPEEQDITSKSAEFALGIYMMASLNAMSPENGCSGTMVDIIMEEGLF